MALTSFKGVNQVLDVISSIPSVESTMVYPRGVLVIDSSQNIKLGDGTTAGGLAVAGSSGFGNSSVDDHLNTSTATSGQVLSWTGTDYDWVAQSGGGGGGSLNNVVEDTTPELGGDLVIGNNKLKYTATGDGGSQLVLAKTIYSVPNTTVFSSVGSIDLFIDSLSADTAQTAFRIFNNTDPDGTVTETNNIFKVDGNTGDVSVTGKLKFPDGSVNASYAGFGANDDLKIFHNGNHSIVRETGTGSLYLQSNDNVIVSKDSDTALMVKGIADGAVELYHNAVKKFETTATGIEVFGDITADAFQGSLFGDDSTVIVDAVNSAVTAKLISVNGTEPTSSGDAGEVGEIRFSDNYIYIKTAGAGWKRANLSGIA